MCVDNQNCIEQPVLAVLLENLMFYLLKIKCCVNVVHM